MMLPRTLLVLALAASSLAWGESPETPARIAQLAYVEGQVAFGAAHESVSSALPDRPLIPGDRLVTEAGGRAELTLGTATVRLDENTELSISTLDATAVRVELIRGTVSVYLRELYDDETFKVATPNTTLTLRLPGEYRIGVPTDGTTDLTVRGGAADGMTAGGPVRVADGQRVRFEGRQAIASLVTPRSTDAFDDWVLEREVQLADGEPSLEQLASGDEYEELDQYGEWYDEPSYGRVWMPSNAYGGYDPFRYGYWQRYGTSRLWVNSMPWGNNTFHSGRWTYLDHLNRWCWVPRRHVPTGEPTAGNTAWIPRPLGNGRPRDGGKDRPPAILPSSDEDPRDVGSTMSPSRRDNPAPRVNRDRPAPAQNAPAPRSNTPTMRASRPTNTNSNREFGAQPEP